VGQREAAVLWHRTTWVKNYWKKRLMTDTKEGVKDGVEGEVKGRLTRCLLRGIRYPYYATELTHCYVHYCALLPRHKHSLNVPSIFHVHIHILILLVTAHIHMMHTEARYKSTAALLHIHANKPKLYKPQQCIYNAHVVTTLTIQC